MHYTHLGQCVLFLEKCAINIGVITEMYIYTNTWCPFAKFNALSQIHINMINVINLESKTAIINYIIPT